MLLDPSDQLVVAAMTPTKICEVTRGEDRVSSDHERLVATEDEVDSDLLLVRRVGVSDLRVQPGPFTQVTRSAIQSLHASLRAHPAAADDVLCVIGSFYTRIIRDRELVDTLLREIQEHAGHSRTGYVIRSRTGRRLTSLNKTWERIRVMAGIPDVRLHDLRHSFASDALMGGVPLAIIGKILGHRQASTTQRYAHLADRVVRDAIELTSARIAPPV